MLEEIVLFCEPFRARFSKNQTELSSSLLFFQEIISFLFYFILFYAMVELIKVAKMAGLMHEADHTYSIKNTR